MKVLILSLLLAFPLRSQTLLWQPTNGPYGAPLQCFYVHDGKFYAGGGALLGFYRSSDEGKNWSNINSGLNSQKVVALGSLGRVILEGTGHGIFRSLNDGNSNGYSWSESNNGFSEPPFVECFASVDSEIFASTTIGLYRSIDSGLSWTFLYYFPGGPSSHIIATDSLLVAVVGGGISTSTDRGMTWRPDSVLPNPTYVNDLSINNNLFNAITYSGVFRWKSGDTIAKQLDSTNFYALASMGTTLILGGEKVYLIGNDGNTWNESDSGLKSAVNHLLVTGGTIYATTADGIYKSLDTAHSWILVGNSPVKSGTPSVVTGSNAIYALSDASIVYRSVDEGLNWTVSDNFVNSSIQQFPDYDMLSASGSNILAGYVSSNWSESSVVLSTDTGNTWNEVTIGLWPLGLFGNTGLAGFGNELYRSTDGGRGWSGPFSVFSKSNSEFQISGFSNDGENIYALLDDEFTGAQIYRTSDSGKTWIFLSAKIPYDDVFRGFATTHGNLYVGSGAGLYSSTDNGATWNVQDSLVTWIGNSIAASGNTVILSTDIVRIDTIVGNIIGVDTIVYLSVDRGKTWMRADSGLAGSAVECFAIRGTTIFAGTDQGVYKADISNYLAVSEQSTPESELSFSAYPNPANTEILLDYSSLVLKSEISLFNILGEQVMSIVGDGSGRASLNVASLPPGVYELVLRDGEQSATQTVIVER